MDGAQIILFDGDCNFCNAAVNFVLQRERGDKLRFATLESGAGKKILDKYGVNYGGKSFVFVENGRIYLKSTAALRVCKYLKGLWPLMIGFIIVPEFVRDAIYMWISKNRYKLVKNSNSCEIPSASVRSKFLNESL